MSLKVSVATCVLSALFVPALTFGAAIEFDDAPVIHDTQLSLGFVFRTNEAIVVNSLGYFDENQDGFLTDHQVGIFDSNGDLLVSTTLSAGAGATLEGHYRYEAIAPITLAADSWFLIAATTGGPADGWAYGHRTSSIVNFVTDARIYVPNNASRFVYQNDNALRAPDQMFGYTIYGGPNFTIGANEGAVPEPATAALACGGLLAFAFIARKRSAK